MIDNKWLFQPAQMFTFAILIGFLFVGCGVTKQLQVVKERNSTIALGNIVVREGVLKNNIETKSAPLLDAKLRVSLIRKLMTPATLSAYQKIDKAPSSELSNENSTTLPSFYYEIELIDDGGYASLINGDNASREYVKNLKKAGAITKLKMITATSISTENPTAFLEKISDHTLGVIVYQNDIQVATIPFSEMMIFDYEISYFCFGKDQRNQIAIMDLVEEGKRCKKPLVKKAKKLTKIKNLVDY